jgi:hypothetical protein
MNDSVDRLRAPPYWLSGSDEGREGENDAPREAADEIERLRSTLTTISQPFLLPVDGVGIVRALSIRGLSP